MKTKEALDITDKSWTVYPESSGLEAAFLSNESSRGIALWYYLSDVEPTENDGHSLRESDWIAFDTSDGSSVWLKSKNKLRDGEVAKARISA